MFKFIFLALALVTSTARAGETCVASQDELRTHGTVLDAVRTFGTLEQLFGQWKLAGFVGSIFKVEVDLQSQAAGFYVDVNHKENKQFDLCVDASDRQILRMHIRNPKNPDNGLLLIKAGDIGATVYVAGKKSNWKYMKFKRIDGDTLIVTSP